VARRAKKTATSQEPVTTTIEGLTHDGRGVARVEGKAVFIDHTLPGERVTFVYTAQRRDFAEGRLLEVLDASPNRVTPRCPHYTLCGGCSLQHVADTAQITLKAQLLREQLLRIGKIAPPELSPPLTGPHWGYRYKARLGVKYVAAKGKVLVGFRERRHRYLAELSRCEILHPAVGERLQALAELLGSLSIREHIPQIEVAAGDTAVALIVRVLAPPTDPDRHQLGAFAREHGFILYLQPGGIDSITPLEPPNPPPLYYQLPAHAVRFEFRPGVFTQVNPVLNRTMIDRVLAVLNPQPDEEILDLFCGLGNFTLPIARHAAHVTGIEGETSLVALAQHNARLNDIRNVEFHCADLSQPVTGQTWAQRGYHKILLDPSRAGAAEVLSAFSQWQPQTIVYVSCNPSTLARDAGILVQQSGYQLVGAGVMDMFPQTAHAEAIAWFERA